MVIATNRTLYARDGCTVATVQDAVLAAVRVLKNVRKKNISCPLPRFKPLAMQPVASGYTDYTNPDFKIYAEIITQEVPVNTRAN